MQNSTTIDTLPEQTQSRSSHINGVLKCILLAGTIAASYWALYDVEWQSSIHAHTEVEEVATMIALIVGVLALVRYNIQRDALLLLLGVSVRWHSSP